MEIPDVGQYFKELYNQKERDVHSLSSAVLALQSLIKHIECSKATTLQGLHAELREAVTTLQDTASSPTSVTSCCGIFMRFITNISQSARDLPDFSACQSLLVERGKLFLDQTMSARNIISETALPYIKQDMTILVHAYSRVVFAAFHMAHQQNKRFKVYVTECSPSFAGKNMHRELVTAGIDSTCIPDTAVGYILDEIDMVVLGADGVMSNGGIFNRMGSYTVALCAKAKAKPVIVLAEVYRFSKMFPITQSDIPEGFKYQTDESEGSNLEKEHPLVDFTPPELISLFITDVGVRTPSAMCETIVNLEL